MHADKFLDFAPNTQIAASPYKNNVRGADGKAFAEITITAEDPGPFSELSETGVQEAKDLIETFEEPQ